MNMSSIIFLGQHVLYNYVDALLKMLSALTGDNSFEEVYNEFNLQERGVTMEGFIEKYMNKGRTEAQKSIVRNLIESNAGTIEQIAEWVKLPVEEVKKIASKVPVKA